MELEELFLVENKWKDIAKEMLAREKDGVPPDVEFIQEADVLGESVRVFITLKELKKVGECAKFINKLKLQDSLFTAREAFDGMVELREEAIEGFACELFKSKVVHDRKYVETYAFWKAVVMLEGVRSKD